MVFWPLVMLGLPATIIGGIWSAISFFSVFGRPAYDGGGNLLLSLLAAAPGGTLLISGLALLWMAELLHLVKRMEQSASLTAESSYAIARNTPRLQ